MRFRHSAAVAAIAAVVLTGCGEATDGAGTQVEEPEEPTATEEVTEADETTASEEPTEADNTEPDEEDAASLPDVPQAYSALTIIGDESALPVGGDDVSLAAFGPPSGSVIPFLLFNGTDAPISRVEVSGRATGGDGETIGTGRSQSIEPNVVLPGGYAIGYVFVDSEDFELPPDAVIEDPAIDYTDGLGDFENILAADVENVERLADSFTGDVTNPHDEVLSGPISVSVACLTADNAVAEASTFTDRDELDIGESSTFTIGLFDFPAEDECVVTLLGASGFGDF